MIGLVKIFAPIMVVALTALYLFGLYQGLNNGSEGSRTEQSLRRLAALTIQNFPNRDLDYPDQFWKSIGREGEPMRDGWGTEYRLSSKVEEGGKRAFYWTSAGPDRFFETNDDIVVKVPYPENSGNPSDSLPGDSSETVPNSIDAK